MPDLSTAQWRKSSYSGNSGGNCLEAACNFPGLVAVRDSKNPSGPVLVFTSHEWDAFTGAMKSGHFS
ncbi:DUF397 domain-containing protein [Sphaerisporangium sp. B11E5]|uniref:DUF397 domain-containing protein n=1 Tax=Sphaerisporangium sp. B11E5 TaxID=3153563 RepID=UPI00325F095A